MIYDDATSVIEDCLRNRELVDLTPVAKTSQDSSAWFGKVDGNRRFIKLYRDSTGSALAEMELAIAGSDLHPAIVPLVETSDCGTGIVFIYDRVEGDNLGFRETRDRFQRLSLTERVDVLNTIFSALSSIADAGFTVVDWYDGNMLYNFESKSVWLFDWELCRRGDGFTLEMDSNYGSSKLMAPEEFIRGSWIDERTTVFNLGRYCLLTIPELAVPLAITFAKATYPRQDLRYRSIRDFLEDFRSCSSAELDRSTC